MSALSFCVRRSVLGFGNRGARLLTITIFSVYAKTGAFCARLACGFCPLLLVRVVRVRVVVRFLFARLFCRL